MGQSKLYTELAEIYDLFYQKHFNYPRIAEFLDSVLKKHKAKKILHAASGPGKLSKILSQKYKYDVHLLDNSSEMIKMSQSLLPELPHTLADMADFHLDEEFDAVVIAGRSFPHLLTDEDIDETLERFHDSLKMGGILIFDTFYADKTINNELYPPKKTVKSKGKEVTRYIKTKVISYDPTIANIAFSFRSISKDEAEFVEVEHLIRAFDQEDLRKVLEKNDFKVLEFAPGIDEASYFTIAKAD